MTQNLYYSVCFGRFLERSFAENAIWSPFGNTLKIFKDTEANPCNLS
jgi:hypothetical protein